MSDEISVVIPVYNGALHLAETIESALGQSLPPASVIVVDDGSEDETPSVAAGYFGRIRYFRQSHAGAASARNFGVQHVETEFLAFLDADDLWETDKLELQTNELRKIVGRAMIFGQAVQFASPELTDAEVAELLFTPEPLPAIAPSALLMRSADFRAVGKFNSELRMGEFIEWYGRAQAQGIATRVLPDIVFHRRLHSGNHGRRKADMRGDYARALKAVLDGRRGKA